MVQTCTKCSRVNPGEAVYCYYDGFVLQGHERRGGPVSFGAQPFNNPFVFPTGRTCRNFDELALACQQEWKVACELLRDGYLESFFGGIGRIDLALAAKEAARYPDLERGLDQLLAKLPSNVLTEPRLRVDPLEVNLGLLEGDRERTFQLELENQGMRLLYGTISSSEAWLLLGEAPGSTEKHFHFLDECRIPVHIYPGRLRASKKPIEGRLIVESNGGLFNIKIRAEKPIQPFPSGLLMGCLTPRQIAEKAQAHPREIAPLFEAGEVEKWYARNGWVYPVKIPVASGPAAIQQFFEALAFSRAPQVEISANQLQAQGAPGDSLQLSLTVSTQEKRPVFAHATSNVPWLEVSRAQFSGKNAVLNLRIPAVPNKPGETLVAEVQVISNGNQRFRIPVTLQITGTPALPVPAPSLSIEEEDSPTARPATPPPPPPIPVAPPLAGSPSLPPSQGLSLEEDDLALPTPPPPPAPAERPASRRRRSSGAGLSARHLVPAVLLVLAVLAVILYDRFGPRVSDLTSTTGVVIAGPSYIPSELANASPRVRIGLNADARFGIVLLDAGNPDDSTREKRLTASPEGTSNNTVVKIDGAEYLFGYRTPDNKLTVSGRSLPRPYHGNVSIMDFDREKIRVQQYLQIVPGPDRELDTVLVYYKASNRDRKAHQVGLRLLFDTTIGSNDGVPFTVPGQEGFVTRMIDLTDERVPDYIEAVERPDDASDPGTIVRLGLRRNQWNNTELLEPNRVLICAFPGPNVRWDWEAIPIDPKAADSCVAVYYPEVKLAAGAELHLALTYGVSKLQISNKLALSGPATAAPERSFVVTGYVYDAAEGQKVTLMLPDGLKFDDDKAEKVIPAGGRRGVVYWKVRGLRKGTYTLEATSGSSRSQPLRITIQARSIFG